MNSSAVDTKTLMMGLSAGRIAVGLACTISPRLAGKMWFGPTASQGPTSVAIRAFGIRDLALGAATIGTIQATGTKGMGFKVLTGLGILCDLVDLGATTSARDELPGKGLGVSVIAGGAAAVGALTLATSGE